MSVHLVDEHGQPLCPIAAELDALDDGAFWERVLIGADAACEPDDDYYDDLPTGDLGPCPECGEYGACAYDAEGRALVHIVPDEPETPQ